MHSTLPPLLGWPPWALTPSGLTDDEAVDALSHRFAEQSMRERCPRGLLADLSRRLVLADDSTESIAKLCEEAIAEKATGPNAQSARSVLAVCRLVERLQSSCVEAGVAVRWADSSFRRCVPSVEELSRVALPQQAVDAGWQVEWVGAGGGEASGAGSMRQYKAVAACCLPDMNARCDSSDRHGHLTQLLLHEQNTSVLLGADGVMRSGATFTIECCDCPAAGRGLLCDVLVLAVGPSSQGCGVGSMLVDLIKRALAVMAESRGLAWVGLSAQSDDGEVARAFWAKQRLGESEGAAQAARALQEHDAVRFRRYEGAHPLLLCAREALPLVEAQPRSLPSPRERPVAPPPPPQQQQPDARTRAGAAAAAAAARSVPLPPPPPPPPPLSPRRRQRGQQQQQLGACKLFDFFDEAPPELLAQIVRQLPRRALLQLSHTCRRFRDPVRRERWAVPTDSAGAAELSWQFWLRVSVAGFIVFESLEPLSEAMATQIHRDAQSQRATPIFNENPGEDSKGDRTQVRGRWAACQEAAVAADLGWLGLLATASPGASKEVKDGYALGSKAGCTLQPKHCDAGDEHQFARLPAADVPLSALRTIMPGSALYVYEGGCADDEGRRVELSADALVVWVGDFVHAGASYEKGNTRLHFYVHSSVAPRVKDETFICSVAEEDEDSSASYEQEEDEFDVSEE